MENSMGKREHWKREREYVLAMAGHVVGLGNVFRFPYLCYKNGGGVFLVPYLFFAVFMAVPLFVLENVIGQYTQEGVITCWSKICPLWKGIGFASIMINMYCIFYMLILAWALFCFINCFSEVLPWSTCDNYWNTEHCVDLTNSTEPHRESQLVNTTFGNLTKSSVIEFWERKVLSVSSGIEEIGDVKWDLLLCLLACWVTCYFCIWRGVRSTGKVVYVTAIFPYVMLGILLVRGLTLPGAWYGVVYFLYPDPTYLADFQVWVEACSQVLFSYGLAGGCFITLSSYSKEKTNCYRDSLWVCVINSATSFVAGFVVFSTLGFMAQSQGVSINTIVDSGPGLAFIAFPQALAMMPMPHFWAVCFFLMLLLLGLDTMFTGLETMTSSFIDMFPETFNNPKTKRTRRAIVLLIIFCFSFSLQIPLTTEGGIYVFQLIDYYGITGACVTTVSFFQCVAVGWAFGAERMCNEVERITGEKPSAFFKVCWRYITPGMCVVCFFCFFVQHEPLTSGNYVYPDWAYHLGWSMALSTVLVIPIWTIGTISLTKGTLRERLVLLWNVPAESVHRETYKQVDGAERTRPSAPV